MRKQIDKKIIKYIFLMSLLMMIPLFYKHSIICGHDTMFHLDRIIGVLENVKIGKIIPVYFKYLDGLGYANGLFYPDIFLYIPALLTLITNNIILSYKIFLYIINLFSLITMYITIKEITKKKNISLYGTFLYSISFYRFSCMHERGALGETLSFIFIPFVILGLYQIFFDDEKKGYYLLIGLVGLMLSHIISLYITILVIVLFVIINIKTLKNIKKLKSLIINIIFSMIITSFFWLPLLEQLTTGDFNLSSLISIHNNIVPLPMLFVEFSNMLLEEWFPAGIGLIYYYAIIRYFVKEKKDKFSTTLYIIGTIMLAFIFISFIWNIDIFYKIFSIIQFPWRFYTPTTVVLIIALSITVSKQQKKDKVLNILTRYTVIIFLFNCFTSYFNIYCGGDRINQNVIMGGEYLPKEVALNRTTYTYKNDGIKYHHEDNKLIVEFLNTKNKELPLIYYKGYKANDSDKNYDVYKTENGYVGVNVEDNTKKIEVYYEGTTLSKISKIVSILGTIVFIIYEVVKYKKTTNYYIKGVQSYEKNI